MDSSNDRSKVGSTSGMMFDYSSPGSTSSNNLGSVGGGRASSLGPGAQQIYRPFSPGAQSSSSHHALPSSTTQHPLANNLYTFGQNAYPLMQGHHSHHAQQQQHGSHHSHGHHSSSHHHSGANNHSSPSDGSGAHGSSWLGLPPNPIGSMSLSLNGLGASPTVFTPGSADFDLKPDLSQVDMDVNGAGPSNWLINDGFDEIGDGDDVDILGRQSVGGVADRGSFFGTPERMDPFETRFSGSAGNGGVGLMVNRQRSGQPMMDMAGGAFGHPSSLLDGDDAAFDDLLMGEAEGMAELPDVDVDLPVPVDLMSEAQLSSSTSSFPTHQPTPAAAAAPPPSRPLPPSHVTSTQSSNHGPSASANAQAQMHQLLDDLLVRFWTHQMDLAEQGADAEELGPYGTSSTNGAGGDGVAGPSRTTATSKDEFKNFTLPLARIKKVMKSDPEVKMISAEVPVLLAKACEIFIAELTCRAWLVAESFKRRTLQKSDVAAAIGYSDMFDFLIDIVPREEAHAKQEAAQKKRSAKAKEKREEGRPSKKRKVEEDAAAGAGGEDGVDGDSQRVASSSAVPTVDSAGKGDESGKGGPGSARPPRASSAPPPRRAEAPPRQSVTVKAETVQRS